MKSGVSKAKSFKKFPLFALKPFKFWGCFFQTAKPSIQYHLFHCFRETVLNLKHQNHRAFYRDSTVWKSDFFDFSGLGRISEKFTFLQNFPLLSLLTVNTRIDPRGRARTYLGFVLFKISIMAASHTLGELNLNQPYHVPRSRTLF